MGIKNDCRRNAEGYSDPTAYEALKNMEQEDGFTNYWTLSLLFVSCQIFILRNGSLSRTNERDEFGGDI